MRAWRATVAGSSSSFPMSGASTKESGGASSNSISFRGPSIAVDLRTGRIGEVMGRVGGRVQLRPVGGGREWDCRPEDVGEAGSGDVLRERVRALNRAARSGVVGADGGLARVVGAGVGVRADVGEGEGDGSGTVEGDAVVAGGVAEAGGA